MNILDKLEYWENKLRILNSNNAQLRLQVNKIKSTPDKQKEFKLIGFLDEKSITNLNTFVKDWGIKYSKKQYTQNELINAKINKKKIVKEIKKIEGIIESIKKHNSKKISELKEQKLKAETELKNKEIEEIEEFYRKYGRKISEYDLHRGDN